MMILFIIIRCFALSAQATNIDSLKLELERSNNDKNDCEIVFEIFKYYNTSELADSMNLYARQVLNVCGLVDNQEYLSVVFVIKEQYKQGFSSNITPLIDSIIIATENPDIKLEFLVNTAQDCFFYENEEQFDKYWSQAQKAFIYAEKDYSKFYYYGVQATKNASDGRLFAALQSIKLAATFKNVDPKLYLYNEYDLVDVYNSIAEYDKAIEVCSGLLKKAKDLDQKEIAQYSYYQLMNSYYEKKNYSEVIKLSHESIDYSIKSGLNTSIGRAYFMIGQSYLELSKLPLEKTNRYNELDDNYINNINTVSPNYLDSVRYYADLGIDVSCKENENRELVDNYLLLSGYFKALGNYEQAISYVVKSQNEQSNFHDKELDKKLAGLWAEDENYSKAYFHLNKFMDNKLEDDHNNAEDVKLAIGIIEDSYKYQEEAEKSLLESAKKAERLRNLIILSLTGLLLSGMFLMYAQRNRKKLELLNSEISQRNKELDILNTKQKETIKYLDNFASVAAHDLKAPIRTASAFADLLAKNAEDKLSGNEKEFLDFIGSSVSKLSGMIDDLLSLSRLDADLPETKQVDLNEAVFEVEILLSNLLNTTNSKIIIESTLPKIIGHPTLISQLFQNIIKNAIVHNKTGNDTVVKISSESNNNDMYTIKVSDNSGGIPDYIVPTMFDLFSSTDKNSGNGIGLATCKKIVNHYGGEIWVDVNPGVGTTFNFNLFA